MSSKRTELQVSADTIDLEMSRLVGHMLEFADSVKWSRRADIIRSNALNLSQARAELRHFMHPIDRDHKRDAGK